MMNKLFWKFKGLISQKSSGRGTNKGEDDTNDEESSRVSLYLLAILSATSFYLFEFFPDSSSEYLIAKRTYRGQKEKNNCIKQCEGIYKRNRCISAVFNRKEDR